MDKCDKCSREVSRLILRNMGGGVHFCKECYSGRERIVKEVVKETPVVKVTVTQAADRVEKPEKEDRKAKKKVKKTTKKGK